VWAGEVAKKDVLATCSLQLAKADSAATMPQQEKNSSADVQWGRVSITGFICTVACEPLRRYTFGEFESLAVASRRR
jgi:hypothetical protein